MAAAAPAAGAGAGDISPLEARVIKQIEFYFGDSNLPRDHHMKAMVALDNGWVPLAHLASFNRMKEISSDVALIAAALKKSKSGLVEVSADGTKVKRATAVPEKVDWNVRAIYAKGFPATATMDSINEFFAPKGKVLSVRVRRNPDKTFKGSAFVEFSSEEEAKTIAAAEHKLADGTVLITLHKPAYMAKKKDEAKEQKGGKKKKGGEAEGAGATKKRKTEGAADVKGGADAGDAKDGAAAAAEPAKPKEYVKDLLVSFAKLPAETTREDLKEACMAVGGTVRYVDYSKSQPAGIVRLDEASAVKATEVAKQLVEKGLLIKNLKPDLSALSGDDEKKAWDVIFEKQSSGAAKKKADGGGRGGRGRGRGRGGRGGGRGRGGRGGKKGGAKADDG